jgi:hypothetical protein
MDGEVVVRTGLRKDGDQSEGNLGLAHLEEEGARCHFKHGASFLRPEEKGEPFGGSAMGASCKRLAKPGRV